MSKKSTKQKRATARRNKFYNAVASFFDSGPIVKDCYGMFNFYAPRAPYRAVHWDNRQDPMFMEDGKVIYFGVSRGAELIDANGQKIAYWTNHDQGRE